MKFRILNILFASLLSFILAGCSESNDPFAGVDCSIVSFTLTQGETSVDAYFVENDIIVEVDHNFDLYGATPTIQLSENATINPNPTEIEDWSKETLFTVKALNRNTRTYWYKVKDKNVLEPNSIMLSTQHEVDEFGQRGVTEIDGTLIIGRASGKDSIRSLEPLQSIKKISASIIFNPTYSGQDIILNNLEEVGSFILKDGLKDLHTVSFPKLRKVADKIKLIEQLTIANRVGTFDCPLLESVGGDLDLILLNLKRINFPNLKVVGGNLYIGFGGNTFEGVPGEINFSNLTKVGGSYRILGSPEGVIKSLKNPLLESVGELNLQGIQIETVTFPQLRTIAGQFWIQGTISSIVNLPLLKSTGSMSLLNVPLAYTNLSSLKLIKGDCRFQSITLSDWSSFSSLETIEGTLFFTGMGRMENLNGFSGLKKVKRMEFQDMSVLQELAIGHIETEYVLVKELSKPITIKGGNTFNTSIEIYNAQVQMDGISELNDLKVNMNKKTYPPLDLSSLKKVNGDLNINSPYTEVQMSDLKSVVGKLTVATGVPLKLTALETVGQLLASITDLKDGHNTLHFSALKSVEGDFEITLSENFKNLSAPLLTNIGGKLKMEAKTWKPNSSIVDLDGFSSVTNITEGVSIKALKSITSFEGLKNAINSFSADKWSVSDNNFNPSYDDARNGNWVKP